MRKYLTAVPLSLKSSENHRFLFSFSVSQKASSQMFKRILNRTLNKVCIAKEFCCKEISLLVKGDSNLEFVNIYSFGITKKGLRTKLPKKDIRRCFSLKSCKLFQTRFFVDTCEKHIHLNTQYKTYTPYVPSLRHWYCSPSKDRNVSLPDLQLQDCPSWPGSALYKLQSVLLEKILSILLYPLSILNPIDKDKYVSK